jgi:type II secretory pathway pseudopilin PulG
VIIITIMGFLVAIVAPFMGFFDNRQRTKMTRERMMVIRTAILGDDSARDNRNIPPGSYVGDRGCLPLLHPSEWDDENKRWDWPHLETDPEDPETIEDNNGTGQPLSLWEEVTAEKDDWRGPYISCPHDEYPGDTDNLKPEMHEFKMRQTEGKLADAWGRSILFWKEYEEGGGEETATLWMISEGPDRKSGWRDAMKGGNMVLPGDPKAVRYDPAAKESKDDIVVKITPNEWYAPGQAAQESREKKTHQLLEEIKTALLGPAGAFDANGRRIISGYLGDLGSWPSLYEWVASSENGEGHWEEADGGEGQPRGLWDESCVEEPVAGTGFRWSGPYLSRPWGKGEEEVLRDGWNNPLKFTLDENAQVLTITSAGPDEEYGTEDDLFIEIAAAEWQVEELTEGSLKGRLENNNPTLGEVIVVFYYHPEEEPAESEPIPLKDLEENSIENIDFLIEVPESSSFICTGQRLVKVFSFNDGIRGDELTRTTVYISTRGTQSPTIVQLVLKIPPGEPVDNGEPG